MKGASTMSDWPVKETPDVKPMLAQTNRPKAAYQCQLIFLGLRESNTTFFLQIKNQGHLTATMVLFRRKFVIQPKPPVPFSPANVPMPG